MRILQLRFRNLNSLAGEWQIDLTDPAYVADGIFAITGPTGAGKSTILDAICLALYGCTPRLGRVTAGGNEIMSRQTGECFAEVTFETVAGRYRCHWSQHRARRKPDGELQQPRQEIANADTGDIIESQIRRVAGQVERVTGMDFERFTRSMLLAQGGFAAFLQADADKRAPILEQITGTGIYSEISIGVHERQRAEKQALELLRAETAGIALLEPEQEQQIRQQLDTRQREEEALGSQRAATQQAISWLGIIDNLNRELIALGAEAAQLKAASQAFEPERQRLTLALQAATLDGGYATLSTTRKQLQQDRDALAREQQTLPSLETDAQKQAEALKAAEQHCQQSRQQLTDVTPLLQQVRSIDQTLAGQVRIISAEQHACEQEAAAIDTLCKQRDAEQSRQNQASAELQQVQDYLQQHAKDEGLVSGLAGIREQLIGLRDRQQDIAQQQKELGRAEQGQQQAGLRLLDLRKQYREQQLGLEQASKNTAEAREALARLLQGKLLREWRAERDSLQREVFLLSRIVQLEEQRSRLADGQPCPLCGATEHPFAEGNLPTPEAAERRIAELDKLIGEAEQQETRTRELERVELQAHTLFVNIEAAGRTASHELQTAEKRVAEIKAMLQKQQVEFDQRRESVSAGLRPLGVNGLPDGPIHSLLEDLEARLRTWQTQAARRLEIDRQLAELAGEIRRLDALVDSASGALAVRKKRLEVLEKERAAQSEQRRELFGDRDPAAEAQRLQRTVECAEAAEKATRARHAELHQRWNDLRVHVEALQQRIALREPERLQLEAGFGVALAEAGFADEPQYLAAVMAAAERNALAARSKALEDRQTELNVRLRDHQARLAAEQARNLTDQPLAQLQTQLDEQDITLRELRELCAALRHQLQENIAARERLQEKQQAIEAQQQECRRWDALHALIGSADGKKYRNFAQGLTFEMMVGHANRQLQKMSDRYLLVRDSSQPLELNVLDNYQAGEVRSTKNLSGGESFIVSLALALGLSQMASRNVRVDSLFLDEGFGTLDEEALDTALDTLAGLQQDGKLIGIISHVQALKERIGTRILVQPQTGGRSRITGPGCLSMAGG